MAEENTPEWREGLSKHFRDQLIYYEDIKPWKLYIRKIIWEHVQQQGVIADITEQANRFFDHGDTKKLLFHYFATTPQKVTDQEIIKEIDNFEINYRVIADYIQSMNVNGIPTADMNWVPTHDIKVEYDNSYKMALPARAFVRYWYANVDKEKKAPLFHLYRKRYYDWVGNDALHKTETAINYAPKHMWKPVLKQMVKTDLVDVVYFSQHPILKLIRVEKGIFEAQRNVYKARYTKEYMQAKAIEVDRHSIIKGEIADLKLFLKRAEEEHQNQIDSRLRTTKRKST